MNSSNPFTYTGSLRGDFFAGVNAALESARLCIERALGDPHTDFQGEVKRARKLLKWAAAMELEGIRHNRVEEKETKTEI